MSRTARLRQPAWTPSRHRGLSATYGVDQVRFPGRDERTLLIKYSHTFTLGW